ncbi:MAG: hypothetical protein H6553_08965 [Chitinophagales bacterium]|nr:hypothetical protein [Chitinophagales bacterium]
MKYVIFLYFIFLLNSIHAENNLSSTTTAYSINDVISNPTKDIELAFSPDNFTGSYAQGIAYNPTFQYYYAYRNIGSKGNNFEVFDINGKSVQSTIFSQQVDNIWYNNFLNKIEAYYRNDNDELFIVSYKFDNKGLLINETPKLELSNILIAEPTSTLGYNAIDNIYYYASVNKNPVKLEELNAIDATDFGHANLPLPLSVNTSDLNQPTLLYTNIKNAEYALYNNKTYSLYLYDYEGNLQKTITLPSSASTSSSKYKNICIVNKHFFVFDGIKCKWYGYKIVN